MKREPNPEDPAYRDKELYERYKQINDPKKPTEGDLLKEKGGYIDTGEGVDAQGDVLLSEQTDIESLTNLQKQQQDAKKYKDFDDAVAGAKSPEDLIKAGKIRKRIEEAEDEIDPETGWPMYLAKGAWWLMQKVGEGFDWVDKQAGIPGTDIDVYHARRKILDPLSETHLALGILGEIFLPDSIDIATAGFSYIPNRFRKAGKVGLRTWASITKAGKGAEFKAAKVDWEKGAEFAAKAQGRPYDMKFLNEEGIVHAIRPDPDDIIPQRQRMIFGSGGIRGGYYDHYKFKDDGWMSDDLARETLEAYQTEGMQFVPDFFKRERDRLLPGFIDEYGDYLVNSGLVSRADLQRMKLGHNVELHHITPLKAGAPLYHDTHFGDEAWTAVTDVFHEHGLFPGMGRPSAISEFSKTNYMMTLGEPHNLLHNKFLAEFVGKTGSKFFNPARMQLIESGLEGRKLVAQEYAIIIKQGQAILEDGMKQMEALFSRSGVSPEELSELLHRASATGELKILDTDLLLRSVNDQLKNIAEEVSWENYGTALGDEVPEVLQKHLDKAIQNFFQRIQKEYGLGGKGGLGKPPVNPYE